MATVSLKGIKKIYDNKVTAVHDFNLEIADKEFIVLVGPSGCGKSTTLRMVAGLEDISEGDLLINGKRMNDVEPKDRDIARVFQNYALYPHMTVYENMAFALKLRKVPKDEIDKKVREAAEILDITQYLERKPKALSGGQRQRVAIGRAIVRNPQVFLMDEPLSNLDAKLRNQMRAEIIKLRQRIDTTFIYVTHDQTEAMTLGDRIVIMKDGFIQQIGTQMRAEIIKLRQRIDTTFIYVTHDQTEAMTLGDRIVIMKDGFIQQIGTPQQVFDHPANIFVAGFIGMPQMNFFDGQLVADGDHYYVKVMDATMELSPEAQAALKAKGVPSKAVTIGIRPEHISFAESAGAHCLTGSVDVSEMMGSEIHLHVNAGGRDVVLRVPTTELSAEHKGGIAYGTQVHFTFRGDLMHLFDPETEKNLLPLEE